MDKDGVKIAIEDIRARHRAEIDLIFFMQNISVNLLRSYVTVGLVSATAAVATIDNENIPIYVVISLIFSTITLLSGCLFCFRAMRWGSLNLPGRDPDFWKWVDETHVTDNAYKEIIQSYIEGLETSFKLNTEFNKKTTRNLKYAKIAGILTIPVSFFAGGGAWFSIYLYRELPFLFHYFY